MNQRIEINKKIISFKKINKKLLTINAILVVGFFASQILVTSVLGTKTQEIDEIRQTKDDLRLKNEILTAQIDKAKTITASQELVERLKLSTKDVTFLNDKTPDDLAYDQSTAQ
ncbi:MAG: hypothetical protein ABIM99_04675 [Candidatus Dojkabacteria bacterium]